MTQPFNVEAAYKTLVDLVCDELGREHHWPDSAAKALVDLHLDPRNFAMHRACDQEKLVAGLRDGYPPEVLREAITFEETHSIRGICRVLVRTHLNRQGIGYVTRDAKRHMRTRAPRVLGPFDDAFDPLALTEWRVLLDHWLSFAKDNPLFNDVDKASLEGLTRHGPLLGKSKIGYPSGVHDNWIKVVHGVYTGLIYLRDRFDMDSDKIWRNLHACETDPEHASLLVKEARKAVKGFGEALAPSFFADLGTTCFIKPDTHVMEALKDWFGRTISQSDAVHVLKEAAASANEPITPRGLDKLLFFGDGGPFYFLEGIDSSLGSPRAWRERFSKKLKDG